LLDKLSFGISLPNLDKTELIKSSSKFFIITGTKLVQMELKKKLVDSTCQKVLKLYSTVNNDKTLAVQKNIISL
jgi:hypothetical protein